MKSNISMVYRTCHLLGKPSYHSIAVTHNTTSFHSRRKYLPYRNINIHVSTSPIYIYIYISTLVYVQHKHHQEAQWPEYVAVHVKRTRSRRRKKKMFQTHNMNKTSDGQATEYDDSIFDGSESEMTGAHIKYIHIQNEPHTIFHTWMG